MASKHDKHNKGGRSTDAGHIPPAADTLENTGSSETVETIETVEPTAEGSGMPDVYDDEPPAKPPADTLEAVIKCLSADKPDASAVARGKAMICPLKASFAAARAAVVTAELAADHAARPLAALAKALGVKINIDGAVFFPAKARGEEHHTLRQERASGLETV